MAHWIYFIHPPRDRFAETMTEAESEAWERHWERAKAEFAAGRVILMGPTLGPTNTGICVFEAPDEKAARAFMEADPAISSGIGRGDLRPFRVSLLRGRE
jgi:uncharacterized protein YciI